MWINRVLVFILGMAWKQIGDKDNKRGHVSKFIYNMIDSKFIFQSVNTLYFWVHLLNQQIKKSFINSDIFFYLGFLNQKDSNRFVRDIHMDYFVEVINSWKPTYQITLLSILGKPPIVSSQKKNCLVAKQYHICYSNISILPKNMYHICYVCVGILFKFQLWW